MLESHDMNEQQPRFSINRSISIGDILVCISLLTAGILYGTSLDKRLTLAESNLVNMNSNFLETKVDARETQKTIESMRTDLLRMNYSVDRLASQFPAQVAPLHRKVPGNGSN